MLQESLQRASLFVLLHRIDVDLAQATRERGCPFCGGPLHRATFMRKPRGGPSDLDEAFSVRLGLCCARCRRRTLPPSVLFWGRKVYWGVVILVLTTLHQQRTRGYSARRIQRLFGVARPTLVRWAAYFREVFAHTRRWRAFRARLPGAGGPQAKELPAALVGWFVRSRDGPDEALVGCLRALVPGPG